MAMPGHQVVDTVPERSGDDREECDESPWPAQVATSRQYRGTPGEDPLSPLIPRFHPEDGVPAQRGGMACENGRCGWAAKRSKPEFSPSLMTQNKAHTGQTEAAVAVVEQNGINHHMGNYPARSRAGAATAGGRFSVMTISSGMIVLVIVGGAVLWLAWVWNRLVAMRARVQAAWASVDALLTRRTDLIPNLVSVVKGAMDFEAGTLERVVGARTAALDARGTAARATAESTLSRTVQQLFAVVERYPDLKANAQILALQQELSTTESDIASARRYYNAVVRDMNILRETFPNLVVASAFGFGAPEYFEIDEGDRAVPTAALERP